MASLIIGPALFLGVIIGLYEALVIHRDVQIRIHRAVHTVHAFVLSIFFVFCSMNAEFVASQLGNVPFLSIPIVLQIAVGLIAAVKIHTVARAIPSGSVPKGAGETWFHSILIGGLIVAAPYVYAIEAVKNVIPSWMRF